MSKYNILWLDDDPMIKSISAAEQKFPEIKIKKVDFVDECDEILENESHKFNAVILDANGKWKNNPEAKANKRGFHKLVDKAQSKKLLVYIFSGKLDIGEEGEMAESTLEVLNLKGLKEGEQIFSKKKHGWITLMSRVVNDINKNNQYYVGHQYMLEFFKNGWIDQTEKQSLDVIMESNYKFEKQNIVDLTYGNELRKFIQKMLECIHRAYNLPIELKEGDKGFHKEIKEKLANPNTILNGKPVMIGSALRFIVNVGDWRSHDNVPSDEIMDPLFLKAELNAFFLVANWFYATMKSVEDQTLTSQPLSCQQNPSIEQTPRVPQSPKYERKGTTNAVVKTYKRGNGRYCDIKCEVAGNLRDSEYISISNIIVNKNQSRAVGYVLGEEVSEDEYNILSKEGVPKSTFGDIPGLAAFRDTLDKE